MAVRTYPVTGIPDLSLLPRDLFDPRWADETFAGRMAFERYRQHRFQGKAFAAGPMLPPEALPQFPVGRVARTTARLLEHPLPEAHSRVRAAAHNELHRRLSYGGGLPTLNFHAQVVALAVDAEGHWLLRATVGRHGGVPDSEAALVAQVLTREGPLAGVAWRAPLSGPAPAAAARGASAEVPSRAGNWDTEVELAGQDPRLAARFTELEAVDLTFHAGLISGPGEPAEGEGRAERLGGALEVFAE